MNWFYESGGQQQGPVSDSALDALIAEGKITGSTLVWHEGLADWKPLREARLRPESPSPTGQEGQLEPGFVRCSLTGKIIPESEAVYIQGKPYSAEAKPAVLQSVQQSGSVPVLPGERTGPPWEHRAEIGFFTAIWETVKGVLTAPSETFSNMKREGGLGAPLLFYVLLATLGAIASLVYQLLVKAAIPALGAVPQTQNPSPAEAIMLWYSTPQGMYLSTAMTPLLVAVGAFIWAGITHLALMICGGAKQPYETTFRVLCYSSGAASLLQLIPMCGPYATIFWGLAVLCIGLAKAHEINTGRAVAAVLMPALICCVVSGIIGASFAVLTTKATPGAPTEQTVD